MGYTRRVETVKLSPRKVNYSPMEQRVIDLLSHGTVMTSEELVKKLYADREVPYYARESVTTCLRALIKKLYHNKEDFTITKTQQGGPYPTSYRKAKVK